MDWKVFKKDDPSTYPEIDCPLLICWTNGEESRFYTGNWDNEDKKFVRDLKWMFFYEGDIFYQYLSYAPFIERECHPAKCEDDRYMCSNYDSGYCLGEDTGCRCIRIVTEYSIGHKRIWKEFEEN